MTIAPTDQRPKLRELEVSQTIQDNEPYYQLSDPFQLSEHSILVPQAWGGILAMFDGETSIEEMVVRIEEQIGEPFDRSLIDQVVGWLDEVYLLENDHFVDARDRAIDEFRAQPFRQPIIAGRGYPSDIANLERQFASYANGLPEPAARPDLVEAVTEGRFGILSPHIDYARGGYVYAEVWRQAQEAIRAADLVFLVGTDHKGSDPFTLTRQDYATPYGPLPTAQDVVDGLVEIIGEKAAFAGELRHRTEHSLELPAVWLHYMRGGEPVEMVPMLIGQLEPTSTDQNALGGHNQLEAMKAYIHELAQTRRVAIVDSGDLCHVGPAFGDAPIDERKRSQIEAHDQELIERLEVFNSQAFHDFIYSLGNVHHVCGVWPTYLMMRLLDATKGELHGYASCPADEANTSAVTIAGMVFH